MDGERTTLGDALARELKQAGVDTVFGVVSIHNLPLYDALVRAGGFKVVQPRGEAGAVNMADAYARVGQRLGVAITSTGTGAGNAAGALVEADAAGSPVLHVTGQVPVEHIGSGRGYIHECRDQLGMLRAVGKAAFRVGRAEQAPGLFRQAMGMAMSAPTGPVSVEIPIDLQAKRIDVGSIVTPPPSDPVLEAHDLDDVLARIAACQRPLMWAGSGVVRANAAAAFRRLADLIDAAVLTTHGGRGAVAESDPRVIGYFSNDPGVQKFVESVDFVLSVGVRFRGNETGGWAFRLPDNHVGIDVDPAAANRNFPHRTLVVGDARSVLPALAAAIEARKPDPRPRYREEVTAVREAARRSMRKKMGPYNGILDAIERCLPPERIVVRDVTIPMTTWGSRMIPVENPGAALHPATVGIGQSVPMAVGASLAAPGVPTVVFCGDGGLMVSLGELATAKEQELPITVVVFDDGGYGILRNLQDAVFDGRRVGVDLAVPDLAALGASFGFASERVADAAAFEGALARAVASAAPSMIVVDVPALGPMPEPFVGTPSLDLYRPH